ncbi:MAG: hypothetical protein RLZZ324_396 [Candidatus Parcubacteria bacterium]|jgi:hypothetical protein
MTDPDLDREVRRIKRGPWQILLGLVIAAFAIGTLGLLFWPAISGPPAAKTLPTVIGRAIHADRGLTTITLPNGYVPLESWVRSFKAHRRLQEYLPRGASIVAAQTVPVLYTADRGYYSTGLIVQNGIVVAMAHMLEHGMSGARVYADCGGAKEGVIVFYDPLRDVLILEVPGCEGAALDFSDATASPNAQLYVSGFMFGPYGDAMAARYARQARTMPGLNRELSCTECSDSRRGEIGHVKVMDLLALSGRTIPGNSGSAVTLANGKIVGMIFGLAVDGSCSFMIPGSTVLSALRYSGLRR